GGAAPESRRKSLTGWRMTQSDAKRSPRSNSLLNRKITGNFGDFGRPGADLKSKNPCVLSGFCPNSLLNGTGNFETRTGNYFVGTGNLLRTTGNGLQVSGRRIRFFPKTF